MGFQKGGGQCRNELKTQLSNPDSALFYQSDLVMLNKVVSERWVQGLRLGCSPLY